MTSLGRARRLVVRLRNEPPRRLVRRAARRARRELAARILVTVRVAADTARVTRLRGARRRSYRLSDPLTPFRLRSSRLRLEVPDASALVRLATAGLLTGHIRRLRIRLASAPEWLARGVRPPRPGRTTDGFRWHRRGRTLTVELSWSRPYPVHRGLADAIAAVLRARPWDQLSGPVYTLDRRAWLAGASSWPQGVLAPGPPEVQPDALGRPLGPYRPAVPPPAPLPPPLVTAVANPYGRRLVGAATRYRLAVQPDLLELRDEAGRVALRLDRAAGAEAAMAATSAAKYAVVAVGGPVALDPFTAHALRTLAACGMVFTASDPSARTALDSLGLVTVRHAKEVDDLHGYALSVEAARRMTIAGDAALRRTALAGEGALPLPAVSVLLSSMRSDHIETCLSYLAAQDYPALEVLVGLHGYEVSEPTRERWRGMLAAPTRVVPFPTELTFGAVLGRLSRMADGELVTKVDDDDHYGRHHVTDLVLAWHTSGADLTAKGARFVHLPDQAETIDRVWTAPEVFDVTPAGGTMLVSRGTLQQLGGWSHSSKHVDEDLLIRVRSAGGVVYRTHALEYIYVRRTTGHTFLTSVEQLTEQGERVYQGMSEEIIRPGYPPGE